MFFAVRKPNDCEQAEWLGSRQMAESQLNGWEQEQNKFHIHFMCKRAANLCVTKHISLPLRQNVNQKQIVENLT